MELLYFAVLRLMLNVDMYKCFIKIHVSRSGSISIIGADGMTFIAEFGYGEEAKELAQYVVNLWNKEIDGKNP